MKSMLYQIWRKLDKNAAPRAAKYTHVYLKKHSKLYVMLCTHLKVSSLNFSIGLPEIDIFPKGIH